MEEIDPQWDETVISKAGITKFAQESYQHESGTKKAVDEGSMSMRELEIYHYLNAWTNHNIPYIEGPHNEEWGQIYYATLEKAFLRAAKEYSISEKDARKIYEKLCHIRRATWEN